MFMWALFFVALTASYLSFQWAQAEVVSRDNWRIFQMDVEEATQDVAVIRCSSRGCEEIAENYETCEPTDADSLGARTTSSAQESNHIESLIEEVKNLKAALWKERKRADQAERKCAEAQELCERRRIKLEETELRVYQLQCSLDRMLSSMSDQFTELKMILHTSSSISASTSRPVDSHSASDSSSDTSCSDSDFTFPSPTPVPPSSTFPNLNPSTFQIMVQDITTEETKGSENWNNDKEGGFEDYF